ICSTPLQFFPTANLRLLASAASRREGRIMATQLKTDPFGARDSFETGNVKAGIYRLSKLQEARLGNVTALPYSIRVLLESLLRNCDGYLVTPDDVKALAAWKAAAPAQVEIPFKPARVVLQYFTGVPCVVD